MDTLANIMLIGIIVMITGTAYIFWKNRDIFSYN